MDGRLEKDPAGAGGTEKSFGGAPTVLLCPCGIAGVWDRLAKRAPFAQYLLSLVTQEMPTESLWVRIKGRAGTSGITVGVCYRPPDQED